MGSGVLEYERMQQQRVGGKSIYKIEYWGEMGRVPKMVDWRALLTSMLPAAAHESEPPAVLQSTALALPMIEITINSENI